MKSPGLSSGRSSGATHWTFSERTGGLRGLRAIL